MKLSEFQKKVAPFDVVSFDIFDTLIERDCLLPSDVFPRVAKELGLSMSARQFRKARMEAERQARKNSPSGEVSLSDIYSLLAPQVGIGSQDGADAEIKEELKACRVKESVKPLFDWALENKRVVLVTDMYLPSEVLNAMLTKCGYPDGLPILNSSEHGVDKVSGRLFEEMAKHLNLPTSKIVHVGDTRSADIEGAHKAGVTPIFIPRRKFILRLFLSRLRALSHL